MMPELFWTLVGRIADVVGIVAPFGIARLGELFRRPMKEVVGKLLDSCKIAPLPAKVAARSNEAIICLHYCPAIS